MFINLFAYLQIFVEMYEIVKIEMHFQSNYLIFG
jgi:hypothetical protein